MNQKRKNNVNLFKSLLGLFRRIGKLPKLMKDPNVALYKKLMVIGGFIYMMSPIDLIADPILGFGFIDDGIIILYIISKISEQLDRYDSDEEIKADKEKIIDNIEYKIDDE